MRHDDQRLESYLEQHAGPEDPLLHELWRETHLKVNMPQMLSGRQQGVFLEMISRMLRPMHILEIGTFTGYSAICLARGLQEGGMLITLEKNDELRGMSLRYFERAGLEHQIQLINGDAREIIPTLEPIFDLVFIDADKRAYRHYLEMVLPRLRPGGIILADNVLWSGKVYDEAMQDQDTIAIREFNREVVLSNGTRHLIVPLRDGLFMIQKVS
jgi:predicted O-methyltransferase YrrM